MASAAILSGFTAIIVPVNVGRVAGIVTIALASAVLAANGVAKAVVRTTAFASARYGIAIIDQNGRLATDAVQVAAEAWVTPRTPQDVKLEAAAKAHAVIVPARPERLGRFVHGDEL